MLTDRLKTPLPPTGRPHIRPVGVGLIGCGRFGRYLIESLATLPEAWLAALASRDGANREGARSAWVRGRQTVPGLDPVVASSPRAYVNWEDLLADPAVDVALIAAPPHLHAEMARAALLAGKDVFLEKPGALAPEDLDVIGRLAAARGRVAAVNLVMRHNPLWRLVREAVGHGVPGALERACVENHAHGDLPPRHWFWDPARSGGIFVEHGVHFFDLFTWIAGPARTVQAVRLPDSPGPDPAPDRVQATVVHGAPGREGALVTYYHAFTRPDGMGRAWAHLAFERGWMAIDGWTATALEAVILADGDAGEFFRTRFPGAELTAEENFPDGRRAFTARRRRFVADRRLRVRINLGEPDAVYREGIRAGFRDLLRRATEPGRAPAGATLGDAARALRLAVAATTASAAGSTIDL